MMNIRRVQMKDVALVNGLRKSSLIGDSIKSSRAGISYQLPLAEAASLHNHARQKRHLTSSANKNQTQKENRDKYPGAAKNQGDHIKRNTGSSKNYAGKKSGRSPNGSKNHKKPGISYWALYILAGIALAMLIYVSLEFFYKPNKEQDTTKANHQTESVIQGIEKNIYFAGIDLENLEFSEFEQKMVEKNAEFGKTKLNVKNDQTEKQPTITLADLSCQYDAKAIYQNAIRLSEIIRESDKNKQQDENKKRDENKKSGLLTQYVNAESSMLDLQTIEGLAKISGNKYELIPVYQFDEKLFEQAIDKIAQELGGGQTGEGQDEKQKLVFNLQTLKFEAENEAARYVLEKEDLRAQIKENIKNNTLDKEIFLKFKDSGALTAEEIDQKLGYISSGYTPFVTYDPPRDANVNRVAELLTGVVIQPGEVFSYMDHISPVTAENGYHQGYQIGSDGQSELVYGGGICQGSSTLYNAVVRADLEIVERNNHTVPSLYITQGMDAMVSDWSDFKFRNNTDYPIAIVATCVATEYIQFDLYGRKLEDGISIDLDPHYIRDEQPGAPKRVLNNDLAPGEEVTKTAAIVGSHWSTDKVYYQDGVEIKREHLNNSYYWPYAAVIEYGPSQTSQNQNATTTAGTTSAPTTAEPSTTSEPPPTTEPEPTQPTEETPSS